MYAIMERVFFFGNAREGVRESQPMLKNFGLFFHQVLPLKIGLSSVKILHANIMKLA